MVKFMDLVKQYHSIKPEIDEKVLEVLNSSAYSGGKYVNQFEHDFCQAHQSDFCVAVNSGTSALHLVYMALDIGPGDEVIVPSNSFFATAEAVSLTGATPVFVDHDSFYLLDYEKAEQAITSRTKAIVGVHLYGQACQLNPLKAITDKYGLYLIEDCAQAHLAQYDNQYVGNFGIAGCFSFYPGKNLGAYGEGGAITTNNPELYKKLSMLRNHGSSEKYIHSFIGHNYRMDGLQAAILSIKLKYLPDWTRKRQENARLYQHFLKSIPSIILPQVQDDCTHVYHLYVIQIENRDDCQSFLAKQHIQTGLHYPIPCHLQKAYQSLGYKKGTLTRCESYANQILSLPMSAELSRSEIESICNTIKIFTKHKVSA